MAAIQEDAPTVEVAEQSQTSAISKDEDAKSIHTAASKISSLIGGTPPEGETPPVDVQKAKPVVVVDETPEEDTEPETTPEPVKAEETTEAEEVMTHLTELAEHLGVEENFLESLVLPTKINGENKEVTLKELKANFQKGEAADLKLMDLSEKRKSFDTELETAKSALQQEWGQIQALNTQLQEALAGETDNLEELRQTDPAEFAARMAEKQSRIDKAKKIQEDMVSANSEKVTAQYQQQLQSERPKLLNAIPEWQDDKTMEAENLKLRKYFKKQGLQDHEIDGKFEDGRVVHPGIIDHRAIVMARKAMLYDESVKSTEPKKKKLKTLPKVGSGKPKAKSDVEVDKKVARRKKAKHSGSQKDAAAIIFDIMNS